MQNTRILGVTVSKQKLFEGTLNQSFPWTSQQLVYVASEPLCLTSDQTRPAAQPVCRSNMCKYRAACLLYCSELCFIWFDSLNCTTQCSNAHHSSSYRYLHYGHLFLHLSHYLNASKREMCHRNQRTGWFWPEISPIIDSFLELSEDLSDLLNNRMWRDLADSLRNQHA